MRIIVGLILMGGVLAIAFGLVLQYAGSWGVPYFSYTSDRGSPCRNTLTGYTCQPLTLADLEYYTDLDLPKGSRVVEGFYTATHDYQLEARVSVTAASAPAALTALHASFGRCQPDHPSPLDRRGLRQLCVMANDDAVTQGADLDSRLYAVGTGLRKDGRRDIKMIVKSR